MEKFIKYGDVALIIEKLDEFIDTYVFGSIIKSIIFKHKTQQWIIKYRRNFPKNVFNSTKDMVDFLHNDQNSD